MMNRCVFVFLATILPIAADIVYDNELIKTEEIFDLDYAKDSAVSPDDGRNQSFYYCTFRSNWNTENHPAEYPELARWSSPLMFSHTKGQAPYLKNREAPYGVEQIAEFSFTDAFKKELSGAGNEVDGIVEGKTFFIDQKDWDKNFVHLPPLRVSADRSYISGIAGISPSPDWFSGFYLFNTIKEGDNIFWDSFMIKTYPWDAGTDDGKSFTDPDRDSDPPDVIKRIEVETTNGDIFKSPLGDKIRHLAEWECVLHTCPAENAECTKPNWPPTNNCDILRFPECATPCDPEMEECEQCKSDSTKEAKVFHKNCCLAGRQPEDGTCEEEESDENNAVASGAATEQLVFSTGLLLLALLLVASVQSQA